MYFLSSIWTPCPTNLRVLYLTDLTILGGLYKQQRSSYAIFQWRTGWIFPTNNNGKEHKIPIANDPDNGLLIREALKFSLMSYINGKSASKCKLGRTLFPTMIEYDLFSKQETYIYLPAAILVLCSESGHWSETPEPEILVFNVIVCCFRFVKYRMSVRAMTTQYYMHCVEGYQPCSQVCCQ
jgi:hypothetical protein